MVIKTRKVHCPPELISCSTIDDFARLGHRPVKFILILHLVALLDLTRNEKFVFRYTARSNSVISPTTLPSYTGTYWNITCHQRYWWLGVPLFNVRQDDSYQKYSRNVADTTIPSRWCVFYRCRLRWSDQIAVKKTCSDFNAYLQHVSYCQIRLILVIWYHARCTSITQYSSPLNDVK